MGLAVGPFGVVDAIAAIHDAEHHEKLAKENRLQLARLACASYGPQLSAAAPNHSVPFRYPPQPREPSDLAVEIQSFTNYLKCCLSRLGTDQHQRAKFLKQARIVLDAMEAELPNRPEASATVSAISHGEKANGRTHAIVS
jgi:hypothetical protein